jgi:drug/metabolite transporter (DMT)-like permease
MRELPYGRIISKGKTGSGWSGKASSGEAAMRTAKHTILDNPYVLLVLAALFWGSNFPIGKAVGHWIPPLHLALFRWGIGILFLLPFAWRELREARSVWLRHFRPLFWMSMTGVVGFNALAYLSLQYTSSISASLVDAMSPIVIVILSFFFLKERLNAVQTTGIVISLIGVVWIICNGDLAVLLSFRFNAGDLIMLIAVFFWAVYSVLSKVYGAVVKPKATFWIMMVIGYPLYAVLALAEESYSPIRISEVPPACWLAVLYIGIFPCVVSFLCWTRGIMKVSVSTAANYLYLCVPFTVAVAFFFGETPTWFQLAGGMILLAGVSMASYTARKSLGRRERVQPKSP